MEGLSGREGAMGRGSRKVVFWDDGSSERRSMLILVGEGERDEFYDV